MKLLTISLTISLVGIFVLLIILLSLKPKQVSSYQDLKLGDYVKTTGKILSIRDYSGFNIIKTDKNITITCNCNFKVNETIIAEGKVEDYQGTLQINADKISN